VRGPVQDALTTGLGGAARLSVHDYSRGDGGQPPAAAKNHPRQLALEGDTTNPPQAVTHVACARPHRLSRRPDRADSGQARYRNRSGPFASI